MKQKQECSQITCVTCWKSANQQRRITLKAIDTELYALVTSPYLTERNTHEKYESSISNDIEVVDQNGKCDGRDGQPDRQTTEKRPLCLSAGDSMNVVRVGPPL